MQSAMAAARSPSVPFAYADWGEALLAKGDLDGALAAVTALRQIPQVQCDGDHNSAGI